MTDNFIEQGGRLDVGVCQARELGAICKREDRRERFQLCLSDKLIHSFSLSGQISANTLSPFLAGKR